MALTTEGKYMIADAVIGGSAFNKLNASNAYIIVGTGAGAAAVGDTVATFTAGVRQIVDSAPGRTNGALTFVATFGTSAANQAWNEWGVCNASSAGQLFSRKAEGLGTKTSAQTWVFTATVTII